MSTVMILGATSGMAKAVAHELAAGGHDLLLLARNQGELEAIAADLTIRHGVKARALPFEALAYETHAAVLGAAFAEAGDALEGVVLCFGYLGDQALAQTDWEEARRILDTNFTAAVSCLNVVAEHLERRGKGYICALSSVAGDRGRGSNYMYGSAKAGLSAYLSGLRNRLAKSGVHVTTIKPGFVDTPMTQGKPGMFLVAKPEAAARGIVKAITGRKDAAYVPGFWALIMGIIKGIPEPVFKRMKL